MFGHLFRNRKGQNTAEYALLIALVVAGIIAMQQYAQRSLQARVRDASTYLTTNTQFGNVTSTAQYEPYYSQSNYIVNKESAENKRLGEGLIAQDSEVMRNREGSQKTTYSTDGSAAAPTGQGL